MLKKRINYWYMRSAAKLGHKLSSNWYKTLGSFERPTSEQMNIITIPIEKKVDAPTQFILPKDIRLNVGVQIPLIKPEGGWAEKFVVNFGIRGFWDWW